MRTQPYSFPYLISLSAFEAAGRHLSFKDAASELNVTVPAISRQIKFLKHELGKPLFRLLHRQVKLTPDGETLLQTLRESFVAIDQATRAIQPGFTT